ncbi:MAG TPA: alanine--tRNA ligase [Acidimicrobiia bacterium]|nr:alanine--tRNA ligase [Acidimicrobiia bacterium]
MDSNQIRSSFTDFFVARDHEARPSASLIPTDPTLLLTNAGMVPFKPYFLGEEPAPWKRATSIQKCARTVDIDIIGTTTRHFSFFEMLGNFSFGDYFKAEAIPWAYELITEGFGIDPERLWFTVYEDDDEAARIWTDAVGVSPERVQRGGKDNFWQMGVPGPCGPSSEIFYDKGPDFGAEGGPIGGGEERFVELWNLVFMQNIQDEPYHVVGELPAKNIDTGMGIERIAAVLQDVPTVFQVDTVWPMLQAAARYSGVEYGTSDQSDVSLRLLADHGRAVTFLIADGVVPSNDGRGYVLRRILRRAVRHAWQLRPDAGRDLVFPDLAETTIDVMGAAYPELIQHRDLILDAVTREEQRFRRTLASGVELLEQELENLSGATLPGAVAFKLHDTYGFPVELTSEITAERGVEVDTAGFEAEMASQRERARAAWKGGDDAVAAEVYRSLADDLGLTDFTGYELERDRGRVLAILVEGEQVERLEEGRTGEVFLDRTPFYAESGGQVGDSGVMTTDTAVVDITDTKHAIQGLHGHRVTVTSGELRVGQEAELAIDSPRREGIRKSHTGTHVLHWALRQVLGDHATQAGSLVEDGRLRFDFANYSGLSDEELAEVEWQANQRLISNADVSTTVTTRDRAKEMGALAFFGDKYGERVRVVKVGDFSIEFCGGTHTRTAGQVGPLIVTSESSIGSNIRRVEAFTGEHAYQQLSEIRTALQSTGRLLKAPITQVPDRVEALLERVGSLEDRLEADAQRRRGSLAAELAAGADRVGDGRLVVADAGELAPGDLRQLALDVRGRLEGPALVVVGSRHNGKGALVAAASPDLVTSGISAGALAGEGAAAMGGGGSRDPELAQAGGPDGSGLDAALDIVRGSASRALSEL